MKLRIIEGLSTNAKVYEVSVDGIPERGRQFIAFLTSKQEKYVIAENIDYQPNKFEQSEADWHKGPGGAYYADRGWGGRIYGMDFERYIYLDELNLIPQSHHDKVASRNAAKEESKNNLVNKLTSVYGTEYGNKLADKYIDTRGTDYVELVGYCEYLLKEPSYTSCYKSLYETLRKDFGDDLAQELFFQIPHVAQVIDSFPDRLYFSLNNLPASAVNALANKPFDWLLSFGYISGLDEDNENLICTPISKKCNERDLRDYLRRKEGLR